MIKDKLTPEILADILGKYPDALNTGTLPPEILARYPDALQALQDLTALIEQAEAVLVPVQPREAFIQELAQALIEAVPAGGTASLDWLPRRSLQVVGAVAIGAGLWYVALRPGLAALRNRGGRDEASSALVPADAAS